MPKKILLTSILVATILFAPKTRAASVEENQQKALDFLVAQTQREQWVETAGASTVDWTLMTLAAFNASQRVNENITRTGLHNFPQTQATDYARKILALTAFALDPRSAIQNRNLIQEFLNNYYHQNHIGDPRMLNDDIWGLIALRAAGMEPTDEIMSNITNALLQKQNPDGSFPLMIDSVGDTDNTASAIIALKANNIPADHTSITAAKNFLHTKQHRSGGFLGFQDNEPNTDSTAWVILALATLGEPIDAWRAQLGTPLDFLKSMQTREGDFWWKTSTIPQGIKANTAFAALALGQKALPTRIIELPRIEIPFRIEGSTKHICTGRIPARTPMEVITAAATSCGYTYELDFNSTYLRRMNEDAAHDTIGWLYLVNWTAGTVPAPQHQLKEGEQVLWYFGEAGWKPLQVVLDPQRTVPQQAVSIQSETFNGTAWQAEPAVTIHADSETLTTQADGDVIYTPLKSGSVEIFAEKSNAIRSNVETLAVGMPSERIPLSASVVIPNRDDENEDGSNENDNNEDENRDDQTPEPEISITVSGGPINFGELTPGTTTPLQRVTISNTGNINIDVRPEVEGASLLKQFLKLNDMLWSVFEMRLGVRNQQEIRVGLRVPEDFQTAGAHTGNLTFWATAATQ